MTEGRLAIWNDCAPIHVAAYEAWYQGEHLVERLGVPGFRLGRRYQAIAGAPEYFTYYEVDGPEVLASPAYVERLENPTPATHRIMTQVFQNMNRTVCRVTEASGRFRGAFAVTADSVEYADPYATIDLRVSQRFLRYLTAFVGVENLLDAGDAVLTPLAPRSFYGGLNVRY